MMATWIATVDRLPEAGVPVLVTLLTPTPSVVLAQYAPAKTLRMHPDADEGGEYDEEQDEYFAEEGWYQCYAVNGSLDDEPYWKLTDTVSHWCSLPVPARP